jgi:hypothetical protein
MWSSAPGMGSGWPFEVVHDLDLIEWGDIDTTSDGTPNVESREPA